MKENIVLQDESDYIFDKTITCPVCKEKFVTKQIKTGKMRFLGTEDDLRPVYEGIDPVKYDAIQCPHCGYAAISSFFDGLTDKQIQKVKTGISAKYHPVPVPEGPYSYQLAIRRYKLSLITAMTKEGKLSESAFICLKLSWLYRAAAAELKELSEDNENTIQEYEKREEQFRNQAFYAFEKAVSKEYPPICNMDEATLNYLMAALGVKCNEIAKAKQFGYLVISSSSASRKIKDKARVLLDQIKSE